MFCLQPVPGNREEDPMSHASKNVSLLFLYIRNAPYLFRHHQLQKQVELRTLNYATTFPSLAFSLAKKYSLAFLACDAGSRLKRRLARDSISFWSF